MFGTSFIITLIGIALCAIALLSVVSWAGQSLILLAGSRQAHEESTRTMRTAIRNRSEPEQTASEVGAWNGYRDFIVAKVVRECIHTTSLYLAPEDGKPIPGFKPGQHITLRFQLEGKAKPFVRCYSLSCGPGKAYYRVSVRHIEDRGGDKGPGVVSNIINTKSKVGDRIPIKAPSGHFFLDEEAKEVVVLLAGGIGITPMVSMLDHLIQTQSNRSVVLVHGSRNGNEQQFKDWLRECSSKYPNVHVVSCYSQPLPTDVQGIDYQIEGFVTLDLLKALLPNPQCQFYLCGPPPFMDSLYKGLGEWGVEESRINFEQFGPSTIKKSAVGQSEMHDEPDPVMFCESGEIALWSSSFNSILELAESNDVEIESGCRAGSCGTCETAIAKGKVRYTTADEVNCNPGCCLPCIAIPDGPLELEA
jgi:ferredoxin-NADP reductase